MNQKINIITLKDLKEIVTNKIPEIIIDARTKQWDDGQRIPGAISLPADTATELYEQLLPQKDKRIIVYCGGAPCPAGRILATNLVAAGYSSVWEYEGGLKEWRNDRNALDCDQECTI